MSDTKKPKSYKVSDENLLTLGENQMVDPTLSPTQEWKLHNGEGKVPEWFIRWSERVHKETKRRMIEKGRKEVAKLREAVETYHLDGQYLTAGADFLLEAITDAK